MKAKKTYALREELGESNADGIDLLERMTEHAAKLEIALEHAVAGSKIYDCVEISRYSMSGRDAARLILNGARITKEEIKKTINDPSDRKRLYALLG